MNFKTTLYLGVALAAVVAVVWAAGSNRSTRNGPPPTVTELLADLPLIPEDFGKVVKLTCTRRDAEAWTFERAEEEGSTQSQWNMTGPSTVRAAAWQVDGIVRKLTGLKYQVKHSAGQAGAVTPAEAGLDPPAVTVTMQNEDGKTVTVAVGGDVSDRQAYVRLGDGDDIYVVSTALASLLKDKAIDYRDQQLFDFAADDVKKLEITDGSGDEKVTHTLVRSEGGWVFEAPVKARAVTAKIDSAVQAMARFRVSAWVESGANAAEMFGLGDQGLTIRATVEETLPRADGDEEATTDEESADQETQPEPELVTSEYVLHISHRSPIGENTKVYVAKAGDAAVGTVAKTMADRMTPNLAEWRDTRLTTAAVGTADRVELTTPDGSASFELKDGKWVDAASGAAIDSQAVTELLKQLGDLRARNFVPIADGDPAAFGLDQPQADIQLNVPGEAQTQRFTVGGYTDAKTRRLVYVQSNQADSVAKVRVADVAKLTRSPGEYRDRTVFDLKANQMERIEITRQDALSGGPFGFALTRVDEVLQLTEPAVLRTNIVEVQKLAKALGSLTATRVVGEGDPATYGLDDPAVTCAITIQPPEITKYIQVEPDQEAADGEQSEPDEAATPDDQEAEESPEPEQAAPGMKVEKYKPPAEQHTLLVGEHDGKVYATRGDGIIYQVETKLLDLLRAEHHQPVVLDFEQSQVVSVTVTEPDGTAHTFAKLDDLWQYTPEPDLPIDAKKITDLLLRIGDLRTERYLAYGAADHSAYGLDTSWWSVLVKLEDGAETGLIVSQRICENDSERRHYASISPNGDGVFLVSSDTIDRFEIDLAEFESP